MESMLANQLQPKLTFERMMKSLHPSYITYLEAHYEVLLTSELDNRTLNFIHKYLPSLKHLIPYIDADLMKLRGICPNRNMEGTLKKLKKFTEKVKELLLSTSIKSLQEIYFENISREYPFFSASEVQFFHGFSQRYGHEPFFYKTFNYITKSKNRQFEIYSLYSGFKDDSPKTISQISTIMNCSYEYVRKTVQSLLSNGSKYFPFPLNLTNYPRLLSSPYLLETSSVGELIRNRELSGRSHQTLSHIIVLTGQFTLVDLQGHTILLNKNHIDDRTITTLYAAIQKIIARKYINDTEIDISPVISQISNSDTAKTLEEIGDYICQVILDCEHQGELTYIVKRNHIDVSNELFILLSEKGCPMTTDELYEAFISKYPGHKISFPHQLKYYLHKHSQIKSMGRKSTYGLESWPQNLTNSSKPSSKKDRRTFRRDILIR